jgi:hypothetical protein
MEEGTDHNENKSYGHNFISKLTYLFIIFIKLKFLIFLIK